MVGVSAVRCYRVELQCWIDFIFRPPLFSALVITTHLYYHQKNTSFYNLGVLFYLVNATHRERGILPCQRYLPNGWNFTWFFLVLKQEKYSVELIFGTSAFGHIPRLLHFCLTVLLILLRTYLVANNICCAGNLLHNFSSSIYINTHHSYTLLTWHQKTTTSVRSS